ncbi:hypothetical protein [Nocardia sp. CY41]|uniref:hypothetical protein n=1 Tax=Nocardia sp. CY41 TaxID=2608686 RepID=UPI00135BB3BE|nr:hypothetical protein [Nocardia sp. CY41]
MQTLIADTGGEDDDGPAVLAAIQSDPGAVSLNTMLTEIEKLQAVRAIGVPGDVFAGVAAKIVTGWWAERRWSRPATCATTLREVTHTLLAVLLHCRHGELTDTLVDLFCATVHRINARAEIRVTNKLIKKFKKVTGKENLLFRLAEATVDAGEKLVRDSVYPVASQATLRDLLAEFKSAGPTYQRTVKATLKGSYTGHYRTGLIKLLSVLEFRSNNTAPLPVLDALVLVVRYAGAANLRYYPPEENPSAHRGLTAEWQDLAYQPDKRGKRRVMRMVYEVATLKSLRDKLQCKVIWVVDADKWRNPAEDLPIDFEARRTEHYEALRKPLDPTEFIEALRAELDALDEALPKCPRLDIGERRSGAIRLTPIPKAPEPQNLRKLKKAVRTRWGVVPLIDMVEEAVLRTGCLRRPRPWPTAVNCRRRFWPSGCCWASTPTAPTPSAWYPAATTAKARTTHAMRAAAT